MMDGDAGRTMMTRRGFLGAGAAALLAACASVQRNADAEADGPARLRTRPGPPTRTTTPGRHPLMLEAARNGVLYVPPAYDPAVPAGLLVMLHGAGGGMRILDPVAPLADEAGIVVLVPESRGRTWDRIRGAFGPDVDSIDRALAFAFAGARIDPARVAIGGFSDGATYALSLGLTNGGLFRHVFAFSPGAAMPAAPRGRPPVFVSHGTRDRVLPIDLASRRIVRELRGEGYRVTYREFDGGHELRRDHVREAFRRLR